MSIELHIWSSAFGLPSIEPESIAAVAYLKANVPLEAWSLIPNHDCTCSRTGDFPYLRDGDLIASGFEGIVHHLRGKYKALDDDLTKEQKADCTAFKAHLRATALPLVDVHLYLSSENNYHTTRPAWTAILPWHVNYFVPPKRRATAKARTEHLGLSGLDIDHTVGSSHKRPFSTINERYESAKTAGLTGAESAGGIGARSISGSPFSGPSWQKGSVQDTLIGSGSTTLFQLENLARACFAPLEELLGDKHFLLSNDSNQPSSLDCLTLGYLSLLTFPDVRKAFLENVLRAKYARLYAYVLRLREFFFGEQMVNVRAVMSLGNSPIAIANISNNDDRNTAETSNTNNIDTRSLPWASPATQRPAAQTIKFTLRHIINSIPLLSSLRTHKISKGNDNQLQLRSRSSSQPPSLFSSLSSSSLLPLTTSLLTFFISYASYAALSEKADVNPHFRAVRGAEWEDYEQRSRQNQRGDRAWHGYGYGYGYDSGYDNGYDNGSGNTVTALSLLRQGLAGVHASSTATASTAAAASSGRGGDGGDGAASSILGSEREREREGERERAKEREWERLSTTGSAIGGAVTGDKTESTLTEVEAEVIVVR